jgi:DNA-binding transcriptional regulator YiaG
MRRKGEKIMDRRKIKKLRKRFGLTGRQLGELLGVSIATVFSWESGRRNPSHSASLLLARTEKDLERKQKRTR